MIRQIAVLLPFALSGCCLSPDAVRVQAEHMSHASQHIDGSGSHMGAELVGIQAHWQKAGWFVNAEEAYNLSPGMGVVNGTACAGGICGNREVFQAQVGYEFKLK